MRKRASHLKGPSLKLLRHFCVLGVLAASTEASAQPRPEAKPQDAYRDQIVAEVDHEPITLHELELAARLTSEYRDLKDNHPENNLAIRQSLRKQLDLLLDERVLLIECNKEKIALSKDDEKRIEREVDRQAEPHGGIEGLKALLSKIGVPYDYFVERKKTSLLIGKLLLKNVSRDIYVEPERIRKYYEEHKLESRFHQEAVTKFYQVDIYTNPFVARIPDEIKQICPKGWNETEAKKFAEKVRDRLAKNTTEWRSIAQASTMDASMVERAGLMQVTGGKPIAEDMGALGKAVDALKPGEVSQVLTSVIGFHIFCLKERSPEDVLPFSEVQHEIQERLRQEIWQERLKAWINQVKDEHRPTVYLPIE